ncbi:type IV secretory system conjugative DNA transfer family protein [Cellulomonas sp. P24]|uniref:type IV secretory system conjugative DNA transfer family protein n=1 Tax=Cellulomonas sp. P24 TaxID=2885206 RepID=UPI0037BF2F20
MKPPAHRPTRHGAGPGSSSPELTDWALIAGGAVLGFGVVLWCGAALACLVTGRGAPDGGPLSALRALGAVSDPAAEWPAPSHLPGPIVYWAATGVVIAAVVGVVALAVHLRSTLTGDGTTTSNRLRALPGLATPAEAQKAAGCKALLRRADVVRPSAGGGATAGDVGFLLGRAGGRELWCSVEDSALLVGPPRMGKGLHVVIPWVLDAPGPVVATSTRPDTLAVTMSAREDHGPVAIFDPQRLAGLPGGLRWSPVRGCETPRTALVRARGLAAGVGFGRTVSDSDFWAGQTETALRCLLHAAALDGRRAVDLYRWSLNPVLAEDAVTILNRDSRAASGWADALEAAVHADPRTRDSVWLGVRQSLAALADPDVLDSVDPGPRDTFDPARFLRESGTLYLLAAAVTSGSCAPLVAAFVEDITETARGLAARSPGARLDPPLLLALDEIANLTPLPSLPQLMAEGGGTGITTLAVLQSLAQARNRWGDHAADAIWDAATVKIILGGLAKYRDLDDVARLLGEIDELTETRNRGRGGERSTSTSMRMVPVMPPSVLRTLPFGTAVLLLRQTRPVVIDLRRWPDRPDAQDLINGRLAVEAATAAAARVATPNDMATGGGLR